MFPERKYLKARGKGRWVVFGVVQLLLAVFWWYAALWLAIGIFGVERFSAIVMWPIFAALVAISATVHLAIPRRHKTPPPESHTSNRANSPANDPS